MKAHPHAAGFGAFMGDFQTGDGLGKFFQIGTRDNQAVITENFIHGHRALKGVSFEGLKSGVGSGALQSAVIHQFAQRLSRQVVISSKFDAVISHVGDFPEGSCYIRGGYVAK